MGVKTAQVWRESKLARETLRRCGRKVRLRAKCCVLQWKRLRAGAKVGVVGRRLRAGAGQGSRYARASSQWQACSEVADRKAMSGILLGNAIADCQTHWQESSEVAQRKAMCGVLLGNAVRGA